MSESAPLQGAPGGSVGKVPPHYACLGVHPSISQSDLARQYKRLSLQLHPDRAAYRSDTHNEAAVQQRFQAITAAYAVLSDPQRRAAYDTQHGVNFHSRVSHVQERLRQECASAEGPVQGGGEANGGDEGKASLGKRVRLETSSPLQKAATDGGSTSDEEDEEYVPERGTASGVAGGRQPFSLYPRFGGHRPLNGSGDDTQGTVLKEVTLHPRRAKTCSAEEGPSSVPSRYGIVVCGNRLIRAEVGDVPFPCVVTMVNGTAVDDGDDAVALMECKVKAAEAQKKQRAAEEDAEEEEEGHGDAALTLTLCYRKNAFDLVGDTSLLGNCDALDALLFPCGVEEDKDAAAEVPSLLAGASVVSVNGEDVDNQQTLREQLRALTSGEEEEEEEEEPSPPRAPQKTAPPRKGSHSFRPRAVWLEFATTDGLES